MSRQYSWRNLRIVGILGLLAAGVAVWLLAKDPEGPESEPTEHASKRSYHHTRYEDLVQRNKVAQAPATQTGPSTEHESAASPEPGQVSLPQDLDQAVQLFKDTTRPLKTRIAEVRSLARTNDSHAVRVLMALGNAQAYLNWVALEALGAVTEQSFKKPVANYLRQKLTDPESRNAEAAIRAYGQLMGEAAVADIAEAIRHNRSRPDGFGGQINREAVKTLGAIGSAAAVPIMESELNRSQEGSWDYEYGSQLVDALVQINTSRGRDAINSYARWLSSGLPEDPMAKEYIEGKIAEARKAAGRI